MTSELFSIGQLARRTGQSVRTIRFWSDSGLVSPSVRSEAGYRLFDAEAVARIDLVRTLRELGLGLEAVRRVLTAQVTVGDVARAHAEALDAEIRILRLRRAVLRTIARRSSSVEEVALMHRMARLSAAERQQVIDRFVEQAFAGIHPGATGVGIAQAMRQMPAELPDDPTAEQVDAWAELAELVQDPSFAARVREMAVAGAAHGNQPPPAAADPQLVVQHAEPALKSGIAPDSDEGQAILDRIVPADTPTARRIEIADAMATFSDSRVERYWQLMGTINGRPPSDPMVPSVDWVIAALRVPR